jgi:hypothetical protein
MYFNGPCGVPPWDPNDNVDVHPGPNIPLDPDTVDGVDGYPNVTLDEYMPLADLLSDNSHKERVDDAVVDVYDITFSYEHQCFDFIYEEQELNGEKHMVLVIRPMRRKKSKK